MWTWAVGTPLLGFFGPQYGPPLAGYGLGWYVGEKDGHRLTGHQGMGEGYNTIVQFAPDDGLAVYAMANRFDPETATGLPATFTAFDVLDVLLGLDK
jgi:CubicO group peptidase (beta-lactamase class C family)